MHEMERQLRLNEDILRFLTLSLDKIEEGPSAILLRKDDERDRNFRGPRPATRFDSGRRRSFAPALLGTSSTVYCTEASLVTSQISIVISLEVAGTALRLVPNTR